MLIEQIAVLFSQTCRTGWRWWVRTQTDHDVRTPCFMLLAVKWSATLSGYVVSDCRSAVYSAHIQ